MNIKPVFETSIDPDSLVAEFSNHPLAVQLRLVSKMKAAINQLGGAIMVKVSNGKVERRGHARPDPLKKTHALKVDEEKWPLAGREQVDWDPIEASKGQGTILGIPLEAVGPV